MVKNKKAIEDLKKQQVAAPLLRPNDSTSRTLAQGLRQDDLSIDFLLAFALPYPLAIIETCQASRRRQLQREDRAVDSVPSCLS
ncbi:hypothetical protein KCU92_g294, partial [Aureobasidium melanogenum]